MNLNYGKKKIKSNNKNKKNKLNKNEVKTKNINKINDKDNPNNYFEVINKTKEEESDKKIKEIEKEIKNKREQQMKEIEIFENPKNKELLKLEIKVLRKIYGDLFIRIPNTFKQNNLTFENFVYEFGEEIHELFEFDKHNPSYDNLLKEVNILIIRKYPITPDLTKFNRKELKKYFYDLGINDDWALIERYKSEMDKIEEKERLVKIANSMKEYYKTLNDQIEQKKNMEKNEEEKKDEEKNKKKKELEKIRIMNEKKIRQLKENEKLMEMMDKEKIKNINENEKIKQNYLNFLEEENKNLNENNYNLIKFKLDNAIAIQTKQMDNYNQKYNYQPKLVANNGYNLSDDQITSLVNRIMLKKKEENRYNFINIENEENNVELNEKEIDNIMNNNKSIEPNMDIKNIDGINIEIENKVNKILQKYKKK
jgi:hypothetical protein